MLTLSEVARTSKEVAATSSRTAKITRIARLLRDADPMEAAIAASWLTGVLPQGRIGVGPAAVRSALEAAEARDRPPGRPREGGAAARSDAAAEHDAGSAGDASSTAIEDAAAARDAGSAGDASPTVIEVDAAFELMSSVSGAGSAAERRRLVTELFGRVGAEEREFLARLLWGELRQGALEGVMADAVAQAADLPVAAVRRAAQLAGDLPSVARAALTGGAAALDAFGVRLFRPLQPMLAQPASDIDDALQRLGRAALDYKLDGARVQVHRSGDEVRVYTRRLNEVTASVPEIVEAALALPVREIVLDGEAIALREDGTPQPFQTTMSRFGSRTDVQRLRAAVPLDVVFFDCLFLDGDTLLDAPAAERFAAMERVLPPRLLVRRSITADAVEAAAFLAEARAAGHEGVVAKSLDAPYEAGRRGGAWLKVKQADTLDLVVLAAEWGSGRRRGWLSNLHLGARDPAGGWVMLGKTFKGLTDVMLEWQTRELLARETAREGHVVHVRPELVVEIAFEGVQTSPRYPGGVALRFARVKRYRDDKTAAEADTIDRVRGLHGGPAR